MISSAKSSFIAAFAEELQRAREYSGVTIDDVASVTHVAREFLDALESGRWEVIPQPYIRGYLQLYARAVGMNVDKVLQTFDGIVATVEEEGSATLDSSSPLLRQPEHIGVTRAKIRTSWFTALTQNRKMAYLAFVAVIVVLLTGLYLSRRASRPRVSLSPFEATIAEYHQTVRGPLTYVNVFRCDSSAHLSKMDTDRITLVGLESGVVMLSAPNYGRSIVRFMAYDTVVIAYDTLDYIAIAPSRAAWTTMNGRDTLRPKVVVSDTAYYRPSDASRPSDVLQEDTIHSR